MKKLFSYFLVCIFLFSCKKDPGNNSYSPIASRTVKDVRFYKNKRTILTGNIYSNTPASTGFSAKVNDQFDQDSVNVSF